MSIRYRNYVYVGGPYSGRDAHGNQGYMIIEQNILNARAAMKQLIEHGYGVFCPHTHSAHFEVITPHVDIDYWYELDIHFLYACQAFLRLPGKSSGADNEIEECLKVQIPVFYSVKDVIERLPVFRQLNEFKDIMTAMRTGKW